MAGIVVSMGLVAAPASAAVGDLTFEACETGSLETGPDPPGSGACSAGDTILTNGGNTGYDTLESAAVSPDRRSVYAVAGEDDAIIRFDRDTSTGELSFASCFTGETETATASDCEAIPGAASLGADSGMDDPEGVTVSPDGTSVYVTTRNDDSIVHFSRDPSTGFISFEGCISGDTGTGPLPGSGACTLSGSATAGGTNSGFDDLKTKRVAISADGQSVYAAAEFDSAVLRFSRNTSTGELTYQGCITGETASNTACAAIGDATASGFASGLAQPRWIQLDPADESLYVASAADHALARFTRNQTTGALTYRGCITGDTNAGPTGSGACATIPSASTGGFASGLSNPRAVAVSPDGADVYVTGSNDSAISRFDRAASSGALTYRGCITGDEQVGPSGSGACSLSPTATANGIGSGLQHTRSLDISFDGRSLYTSAQNDATVMWLDRDLADGALSFGGCLTGNTAIGPCDPVPTAAMFGQGSGLADLESATVSPDGRSVYGTAAFDDAISLFSRERDLDAPNTRLTKKPKKETTKRKANFRFKSNEAGSTFECKLDRKKFKLCDSPFKKKVKVSKHKFKVRAIDSAGNVDPTPAKRKWKVVE
jgi:6-phosphogluconolactonase (cycloisomerase 2 family)